MRIEKNDTRPWGEDDTQPETDEDIGCLPTLRWLCVSPMATEPVPATLRLGSGTEPVAAVTKTAPLAARRPKEA
jgi:hypothetical protein